MTTALVATWRHVYSRGNVSRLNYAAPVHITNGNNGLKASDTVSLLLSRQTSE